MVKEYYHFSEDPFDLRPDPKFLYLARSHGEVLSALIAGIKERKGIIVVTGEVGTGKTILMYALLKDLNEKIKTVFIFNPTLDFQSMLETILQELKVPVNESGKDIPFLLQQFTEYLNQRFTEGEIVTLVIDEAQSLNEEVLENLCRLLNPDTPAANSLLIFLIGHPGLEKMLDGKKLGVRTGKVGLLTQIKPLTRKEGKGYIHHRLKVVGREISEIFTAEAIDQIWKYARGIPRVMNLICDRSLFIGYEQSRPIIDSGIVNQAIADVDNPEDHKAETYSPEDFRKTAHYKIMKFAIFLLSLGLFLLTIKKIWSVLME